MHENTSSLVSECRQLSAFQGLVGACSVASARQITSLWETITKQKLPPKKNYLTLEAGRSLKSVRGMAFEARAKVSASDMEDGVDVVIPTVKFQFRRDSETLPGAEFAAQVL